MNVILTHPLEDLALVAAHDVSSFCVSPLSPPSNDQVNHGQTLLENSAMRSPELTEDQAREAFGNFGAELSCCGNKSAHEDIVFRNLEHTSALHYILETVGESRQSFWTSEPYHGEPIDSCENGPAPDLWDIEVAIPSAYEDTELKIEVPHTASIEECLNCLATGKQPCFACSGTGQINYHGSGQRGLYWNYTFVFLATNTKKNIFLIIHSCHMCIGRGKVKCLPCNGKGQVKDCTQLMISWKNHVDDFIVKRASSLPDESIREVSGQLVFEENLPRVEPINHFPDEAINIASTKLIQQHDTDYSTERIIRQRHRVRIVPVTQVDYTWKQKSELFFVYGFENKVYALKYPQKFCCGCCIL